MAVTLVPSAFSHTISALSGPPTPGGAVIPGATLLIDWQDGGRRKVSGTVKIDSSPDIPVRRKVRLFCAVSGRLVRETWSDPVTGAYSFEYVRPGPWMVTTHDYTGSYNAVVADNILAEPM